jgi:uncharacterized protein (DUF58 family)
VALAALGLLAGLVLGRPELVALGAPFGALVALGLALARDPGVSIQLELERDRAIEDDELVLTVTLTGSGHVEVALPLPRGIELADGPSPVALRLRRGQPRTLELRLHCARWGAYVLGEAVVRAHDRFGLYTWEGRRNARLALKVYPSPEILRDPLAPLETQATTGNYVARTAGDGIEFADMRAYVPGDRMRTINWRASARRGELWVNQMHPERNADVVLFLDTFTEAAHYGAGGTLDYGVRAAAELATQYLEHRDRVGLVSFGGILKWLVPAGGIVQRYRIVDALLDTEIVLNYAWKDVEIIPRGTLPPKALVVALTPLLDERAVATLLDLRARGFDLTVIELSPVPYVEAAPGRADAVAYRLWLMRREVLRSRYRSLGVPIVEWREGVPAASVLEEVRAWRRVHRFARA